MSTATASDMKSVTTEDLIATICNFPKCADAPAAAAEYLYRCGGSGHVADLAAAIVRRDKGAQK